jgi:hypothetical protein
MVASSPPLTDAAPSRGFVPLEHLGREFVPVDLIDHDPARASSAAPSSFVISEPDEDWSTRTSLFGDAEA